jgi:hypothetical protein
MTALLTLSVLCVSCGSSALVARVTTEPERLTAQFTLICIFIMAIGAFGLAVLP